MLNALEISKFIRKYYKYFKKNNIIYNDIIYDIIGSERQFEIALQKLLKDKNHYFSYIINYNTHWVYLFIIKTNSSTYKIFFYDSLGRILKYNFYEIIRKILKNCYFIYVKKQQQFSGNTCGIFVIVIHFIIFSLINKNVNSINKILYIIENNNINSIVDLFIKNEFNTERN
jgi:hypothetical protein